ncbi:MAG TPA: gluconokinase, partial [Luteimonas sp.]|nr:gluconokinase [Luteimonas sp.]
GSGKTTLGRGLAGILQRPFLDADDLHPAANHARLAAGIALTDADRGPWLAAVAAWIEARRGGGVVVACSALRRRYRDVLRGADPGLLLVALDVSRETLVARVRNREGHFMAASLLDDQLATLEVPAGDERVVHVPAGGSADASLARIVASLQPTPNAGTDPASGTD